MSSPASLRTLSTSFATAFPASRVVRGKRKVLLVAADLTRMTPVDRICRELLDELNRAGVADGQIEILIALGTHRPMTEPEIEARFGIDVIKRVRVLNHPWRDEGRLAQLGSTLNGSLPCPRFHPPVKRS